MKFTLDFSNYTLYFGAVAPLWLEMDKATTARVVNVKLEEGVDAFCFCPCFVLFEVYIYGICEDYDYFVVFILAAGTLCVDSMSCQGMI